MVGNSKRASSTDSFTEDGINFWRNPKSPNGSFLAQYRLSNGDKKCIGCGSNELGKAYKRAIDKRKRQEQEIVGVGGKDVITVDQLCELFITDKERLGCSPDTLKMFRSMTYRIRGYRLCHLKSVKVYEEKKGGPIPKLIDGSSYAHQLVQADFDDYVKSLRKVLADGTLRTFLSRVATMFKWAGKEGYAKPKIKFKKFNKQILNSPIKSRKFKDEELDQLLDWLKNKSKRGRHNYYRLLCCSELGLRIGEVCSIRIANIDLSEKTLQIARLKKKGKVLEELRMTDYLVEELGEYIDSLPVGQAFLFQGKTGKPLTASSAWFRQACVACELDIQGLESLVLHSARSKFIMDQLDDGRPLPKIMGSVGHSSITTTMRYLRISSKQSQLEAVEASNDRRIYKTSIMRILEAQAKKMEETAKDSEGLSDDLKKQLNAWHDALVQLNSSSTNDTSKDESKLHKK